MYSASFLKVRAGSPNGSVPFYGACQLGGKRTAPEDKAGTVRRSIKTRHSIYVVKREVDELLVLSLNNQSTLQAHSLEAYLFVFGKANLTAPRLEPHPDVLVLFILPLYPASRKWGFSRYGLYVNEETV